MNLVLDTSILVHLVRDSALAKAVKAKYGFLNGGVMPFISEVSVGEIYSLSIQFKWGSFKLELIDSLLIRLKPLPISYAEIMNTYALIDAYSQNRHPEMPIPPGTPARKMGKNDLWIAATTTVLDATLLTTDSDFEHLSPRFFQVENVVRPFPRATETSA